MDHPHFHAPTALPVLTVNGVGLWAVTSAVQRYVLHEDVEPDPSDLEAPRP